MCGNTSIYNRWTRCCGAVTLPRQAKITLFVTEPSLRAIPTSLTTFAVMFCDHNRPSWLVVNQRDPMSDKVTDVADVHNPAQKRKKPG